MDRVYGVIGAALIHCLLFGAAARLTENSKQRIEETIVSATIIAPQIEKQKEPKPDKPKPKKVPQKTEQQKPVVQNIASASSASQNTVSEVIEPKPQKREPPQKEEPLPPAPVVIPPNFNADYLHNPAPAYPTASRKLNEEGKVILRVLVSAQGEAKKVEIKTQSGFERLDKAAADAVQNWKFVPAKKGSEAIEAWVNVPIIFKLGA